MLARIRTAPLFTRTMQPLARKQQRGVTAIEYALIASLIAVGAILAMQAVGQANRNVFDAVGSALSGAFGTGSGESAGAGSGAGGDSGSTGGSTGGSGGGGRPDSPGKSGSSPGAGGGTPPGQGGTPPGRT
jgi:Flp pilus assembly pilin Flp